MGNSAGSQNQDSKNNSFLGWIVRMVLFAIVLGITSAITPGFSIKGSWSLIVAAIIITITDYFFESFMGVEASPIGKGVKGFIIAAIIIYLTQFFVSNMKVSIIGSLLASIVIGIIDAIIPEKVM